MGFEVYHSPSARSLGNVSYLAGLGDYRKYQQARRDRRRALDKQLEAQRAGQERGIQAQLERDELQFGRTKELRELGIEAQKERDSNYQDFQRKMKELGLDQQLKRLEAEYGLRDEYRKGDPNYDLKRDAMLTQEARRKAFVGTGWGDFVGSIDNLDQWSPAQQNELNKIQADVQEILGDKSLSLYDKESALKQAIAKVQGIQKSIVRKQPTEADQWAMKGQPVGGSWIDPVTGNLVGRRGDGKGGSYVYNISRSEKLSPAEKLKYITERVNEAESNAAEDADLLGVREAARMKAMQELDLFEGRVDAAQPQDPAPEQTPVEGQPPMQEQAPPTEMMQPQPHPGDRSTLDVAKEIFGFGGPEEAQLEMQKQPEGLPEDAGQTVTKNEKALKALGLSPDTKIPSKYKMYIEELNDTLESYYGNPSKENAEILNRILIKIKQMLNK